VSGITVAGMTALISGVSVFVNSYGLRTMSSPAVYTTAKNMVAAVVIAGAALCGWLVRGRRAGSAPANFVSVPRTASGGRFGIGDWMSLAYVGLIGGGLAFVLFFDGLAQSEPASAAFWRDTLVVWVALLAVAFLRERIRWWNLAAMVLLVAGEIILTGGVGRLTANRGEMLVVLSSMLWAVEVVVARRLLRFIAPATLSLVRMGLGAVTLLGYLASKGATHLLWSLNANQMTWALWTGLLLSAYVATWMTALSRARALDVTSVLVASALITWLLQLVAGTVTPAPSSLGLLLIVVGAVLVVWAGGTRMVRSSSQAPSVVEP
jgi:drug/metabolite transporter (DMT)-like permease